MKAVVADLVRNLRASDVVGRLGGDEFGAVLWNTQPAQASLKGESLEGLIAQVSVEFNGMALSCGASAGVIALDPASDPAKMIASADEAMYARKRTRRA